MLYIWFNAQCSSFSVLWWVSLQQLRNLTQLPQIVLLHHHESILLMKSNYLQGLDPTETSTDSLLESFVWFVNFPCLFISVILYDIRHVYIGSIEESFSSIGISMHSHHNLLALYFKLLQFAKLFLLDLCLYSICSSSLG